jgi:hypothetical protein
MGVTGLSGSGTSTNQRRRSTALETNRFRAGRARVASQKYDALVRSLCVLLPGRRSALQLDQANRLFSGLIRRYPAKSG